MKTLVEKKNDFFQMAHQQGVTWEQAGRLWNELKKLGVRDDTEPVGLTDGVALIGVERQAGHVSAVRVEEEGASFILTKPRLGGPHPVTDLKDVFDAIEKGVAARGDLGITRQRISDIVAAIQEAGFAFYTAE